MQKQGVNFNLFRCIDFPDCDPIKGLMKLLRTHLSRPLNEWSMPLVGFILVMILGISLAYWNQPQSFAGWIARRTDVFERHEYWRLFSTIAIHADLKHFLANSAFFFIFGFLLHGYFGVWVFPLLSLAVGALANYLTLWFYPESASLIGASGVVYFMVGLWATLFFFIERKGRALKRVGMLLCVTSILLFPTEYRPEVSYLAHFWGFVLGIPTGAIYFWFRRDRLRSSEVWSAPEPDEEVPEISLDDVSDS